MSVPQKAFLLIHNTRQHAGPTTAGRGREHTAEASGQDLRSDGQEPRRSADAGGVPRGQQSGSTDRTGAQSGRRLMAAAHARTDGELSERRERETARPQFPSREQRKTFPSSGSTLYCATTDDWPMCGSGQCVGFSSAGSEKQQHNKQQQHNQQQTTRDIINNNKHIRAQSSRIVNLEIHIRKDERNLYKFTTGLLYALSVNREGKSSISTHTYTIMSQQHDAYFRFAN